MDPVTIGTQIKAKYPQYAQYDPAMLGQRWIDVHVKKPAGSGGSINMGLLTGNSVPQIEPDKKEVDLSGIDNLIEGDELNIPGLSGNSGLAGMDGNAFQMPQLQTAASPQTTSLGNGITALTYDSPIKPDKKVKPEASLSKINFNKQLFDERGGWTK